MNFNIDTMPLNELKEVMKIVMRNLNNEHDRVTELQDRVLQLEMQFNELKNEPK